MSASSPPPPQRREITDVEAMKALAHPLRQRIGQLLRRGPGTSTTLARELGESTGTTSYHLRQLARYGYVEEAPELSRGRERWWRAAQLDLRWPLHSQQSPEMRVVVGELERIWWAADLAAFTRFQADRDRMGAWGDALPYSRGSIRVTLEQLRDLFEEYIALLNRYRADEGTPGTRTVQTRFLAFPDPGPPAEPATPDDHRRPEEPPEAHTNRP